MSSDQESDQPEKPDPYLEWLDKQDQELEELGQFIKDNKLGGYSDKFANVDPTADDEGDAETPNSTPNDAIIDNSKFPLTTQTGLSPKDQALIDAINLDELREAVRDGKVLSEEQNLILEELETKNRIRKASKSLK